MLINEKIRFMRQQKGWSQEEIADRLNMSPNGYGNIERGYTNINMTKLNEIAELFDATDIPHPYH
jgi:transcriptional regulator with XRE-family HTH domain